MKKDMKELAQECGISEEFAVATKGVLEQLKKIYDDAPAELNARDMFVNFITTAIYFGLTSGAKKQDLEVTFQRILRRSLEEMKRRAN